MAAISVENPATSPEIALLTAKAVHAVLAASIVAKVATFRGTANRKIAENNNLYLIRIFSLYFSYQSTSVILTEAINGFIWN
jgi:hypothetical protein